MQHIPESAGGGGPYFMQLVCLNLYSINFYAFLHDHRPSLCFQCFNRRGDWTYFAKRRAASVPSAESTVCLFCSLKDLILKSGAQQSKWDESSKTISERHQPTITQELLTRCVLGYASMSLANLTKREKNERDVNTLECYNNKLLLPSHKVASSI